MSFSRRCIKSLFCRHAALYYGNEVIMIVRLPGDSCPFANTLALAPSMVNAYFGAKEIDDRKLTAASLSWMPRSYERSTLRLSIQQFADPCRFELISTLSFTSSLVSAVERRIVTGIVVAM